MKNVGSTLLFPHLGKKISDSGIATFFYFSSLPQRLHESRDKDEKKTDTFQAWFQTFEN